eukprot:GILJ01004439.1.p1 GENE.GILJ01004439.1~~GILJ01004439.1.p1  ORF type:complete len:171 (-),score=28.26 GILJ01004439.1:105-575(-)
MAEKSQLSSKILGMKFMQRQQEAEHRAKLQKQQNIETRNDQSRATNDGTAESKESDTTADAMLLRPGRRSFGNFNPAIEKHVKATTKELLQLKRKPNTETPRQEDTSVSVTDREMAARMAKPSAASRGEASGRSAHVVTSNSNWKKRKLDHDKATR